MSASGFTVILQRFFWENAIHATWWFQVQANQELTLAELGIAEGDSALLINGISVDVDPLDVFGVLELLKQEVKLADGFYKLGFKVKNYCYFLG